MLSSNKAPMVPLKNKSMKVPAYYRTLPKQVGVRGKAFEPVLMVIDDYPPGQRLLTELSRYVGLKTIVCANAKTAAEVFSNYAVAAIIIDTDTHGSGWQEFVRNIRTGSDDGARMPVITLNASSVVMESDFVQRADIAVALMKPICVSDFFETLERLVSPRLETMRGAWQWCKQPDSYPSAIAV